MVVISTQNSAKICSTLLNVMQHKNSTVWSFLLVLQMIVPFLAIAQWFICITADDLSILQTDNISVLFAESSHNRTQWQNLLD